MKLYFNNKKRKKIAISQSNYIPWKGYFDLINSVDVFVFYDVVQYTKNDWRNRNKLISAGKPAWLTLPVFKKSIQQKINETTISDPRWVTKHLKTIKQNYSKASGFEKNFSFIESLYNSLSNETNLSTVNTKIIITICRYLGIKTEFRFAEEFDLPQCRIKKLISICDQIDANIYVSGPSAKSYLNEDLLGPKIKLEWFKYENYSLYNQLSSDFCHQVSIIDLLMCCSDHTHLKKLQLWRGQI